MTDNNNSTYSKNINYSNSQLTILVILRMVAGWHFLYEGVIKLMNPNWSAVGFLLDSKGIFAGFFQLLADNQNLVKVIDLMNEWGLLLVGLGLITGFLTQIATLGGMVLLAFYYMSHPPLIGVEYAIPSEGSYLWVNKNLVEFFTLWVLFLFPTGKLVGLDRFILNRNK
jgi:thiosulfate dehydrogenase (quinone) large subunit